MSLAELCITILLTSLLLASAWLQGTSPKQESLRLRTKEIVRLLEYESIQALLENKARTLAFDLSSQRIRNTEEQVILRLPPSVRLLSARFGTGAQASPIARFDSSGIASPGSIIIQGNENTTCKVFQALRGAVRYECQ